MQLLLGSMSIAGVGLVFTPAWKTGLVFIPAGAALWVLFSALRFSVTDQAVCIRYGPFGPTIPIAAIERVQAVDYDWKRFGGWGIRRSLDGEWMYNMPGDRGRAMRIVWTDAKGRRRITSVGTADPEPAAAAVQRAMQTSRAG